ncbi:Sulfite exporter TauE/SafE family protein, putative isoform 1 [Hibiscus syriacus]|uniref:Sulfite exporter TauE/SafE family protein, putative isoform 1 n=1 Tax=Hibiscus syriacus TaxID=106335 RepID=A0A6A3AP16_HIBSY|nr:uncharacterized protein LOC120125464 [Hibiscus syriacus]KAE8705137.1 Sulfite exporter TauE/SafE family protein, putative isoform 1 [Hibiscus syriacus]
MDATRGRESTGLLDEILPPRLEDAGLEDCALPPDSIHEAFLKAASAVNSRSDTLYHSDDEVEAGFVDGDPFPNAVVVVGSSHPPSDSEEANERVVLGGEPVVGKGCLDDELKCLKIEEKETKEE